MALKSHPIADVFPMLDDADTKMLADDIAANGIRHPIVLFEGSILDGRNRYKAAKLAGYETKPEDFTDFTGDWDAAVAFVTSENLARRHLTSSQRAMAAAKLATLKRGDNQHTVEGEDARIQASTQKAVAKQLGVGRFSVQAARRVREKGVPALATAVEKGKIAVSAAAELTKLPKAEQEEVVAAGKDRIAETVSGLRSRPLVPQRGLSATQIRVQKVRSGQDALAALLVGVKSVEELLHGLVSGNAELPEMQRETVLSAADRLRVGAEWITTFFSGNGFSDAALHAWLKGGSKG